MAVVVNYNAREQLLECLESLKAEGVAQLVVVDNGSSDGSAEAVSSVHPDVEFIQMRSNLGYGAAANRGVGAGSGDPVLVCNPDVVLHGGALVRMSDELTADPAVALVGPAVENEDGTLYPSARTFPSVLDAMGHAFLSFVAPGNAFSRRYKMLDWDHLSARQVDWVSGACFLVRRDAFTSLGGFDESYFMYMEDVDLCWRAARVGWKVLYEPAARVTHLQGVSADRRPYRMIAAHHRSLLRFANRTTSGWRRGLLPLVAVGLGVRAALACAQRMMLRARNERVLSTVAGGHPPVSAG